MVEGWCAVPKSFLFNLSFRGGHRYCPCSRNDFCCWIVLLFLCVGMCLFFYVHHLHGHCVYLSCCDFGAIFIHFWSSYFPGLCTIFHFVCFRFQTTLCHWGFCPFLIQAGGRLILQVLLFLCASYACNSSLKSSSYCCFLQCLRVCLYPLH